MSNVTVQEALNNTLVMLDALTVEFGISGLEHLIAQCEAALSEIERCEPVGYILTATLDKMKLAGTSYAHLHSCIGQQIRPKSEYTEFYTSPISKEWVGLTDDDCDSIREIARDMLVDNDTLRITEAKCKQLNAPEKG